MLSIYEMTKQGEKTRSRILVVLRLQDGLTRNELVKESGLSYEQVRNQTQNLVIDGKVRSRIDRGQRRYYLAVVVIFVLFIPLITPSIEDDSISDDVAELIDS